MTDPLTAPTTEVSMTSSGTRRSTKKGTTMIMFRNPETRRIAPLFAHADAGVYTLPAEVMKLREEMHRLTDYELPGQNFATAGEVAAVAFRSAAATGDGWPDIDQLVAVHARNGMLTQLARVRAEVLEQIESSMYSAVVGRGDEIIVKHLHPVFDEVLAGSARRSRRSMVSR